MYRGCEITLLYHTIRPASPGTNYASAGCDKIIRLAAAPPRLPVLGALFILNRGLPPVFASSLRGSIIFD